MKLKLNDEQCKHLAVTLRTISAGLFLPMMLNLLGFSPTELGYGKIALSITGALIAEIWAYLLLKQFDAHDNGGTDDGTD